MSPTDQIQAALSGIPKGVCVITAKSGDKINGCAAAWVCQVSFEPALIMVALGEGRHTHQLLKEGKIMGVCVLAEGQTNIGRHFGRQSGRQVNKFTGIDYFTSKTGAPLLKDAAAWLDCRIINTFAAGDHTLFIGEILAAGRDFSKKSLVYKKEDYYP